MSSSRAHAVRAIRRLALLRGWGGASVPDEIPGTIRTFDFPYSTGSPGARRAQYARAITIPGSIRGGPRTRFQPAPTVHARHPAHPVDGVLFHAIY